MSDLTIFPPGVVRRWVAADAAAYASMIRERRALDGGATTMGFALLTLRRT